MGAGSGKQRVPKPYRYRLHKLKNAYRKTFHQEPDIERPFTDEAAARAILFLENALREAGMPVPNDNDVARA